MTARTRGRSGISTHAPRTGSDTPCGTRWKNTSSTNFNPRSPHGERRFRQVRPAGAARHFNPRSPHGERRIPYNKLDCQAFVISTHAPRTGSDARLIEKRIHEGQFQPTLPARGATRTTTRLKRWSNDFNPRSPHGERREVSKRLCGHDYFNPRSPHGERHIMTNSSMDSSSFQPTLPARGATAKDGKSPRRDGDFNPRSPHGERRGCLP